MTSISPDVVRDLLLPDGCDRRSTWGNTVLAQRASSGETGGVSVELARECRVGVEPELHPIDTAGSAFAALASGACDRRVVGGVLGGRRHRRRLGSALDQAVRAGWSGGNGRSG